MHPLQESFLALATASGTPLEQDLAVLAYLDTLKVGLNIIVQQEEAAAATHARFASIINKAEQRKVSSQHSMLALHACRTLFHACGTHAFSTDKKHPCMLVFRCSCRPPTPLLAAAGLSRSS
jgi:hypothetical protein